MVSQSSRSRIFTTAIVLAVIAGTMLVPVAAVAELTAEGDDVQPQAGAPPTNNTTAAITPTRTLNTSTPPLNGSVEVTLDVAVNQTEDRLSITESFEPEVGDVSIGSVRVDGTSVIPVTATGTSGGITVAVENVASNVSVTYTITLSSNASDGDSYSITGNVSEDGTNTPFGASNFTVTKVVDPDNDGVDPKYEDETGRVTNKGLSNAASDWTSGTISSDELVDIVTDWAAG